MSRPEPNQRLIQGSPYVDDDGAADPALVSTLQAYAGATAEYPAVLAALAGSRLLVPVVAVLGDVEHDAAGLARDKSSDMATVLLTAPDGRQALLAFTGTDAMSVWAQDARPVPVGTHLAAATAVQEGADALVVDVGSDYTFTVSGDDLARLASGWRPVRLPDGGWAWMGVAGSSGDSHAGEQLG